MTHTLTKIVAYAAHITEPESIILFGSYVKGKENIHSDIDLLIVTKQVFLKRKAERDIISFAKECSMKADVLIHTCDEVERASEDPFGFLNSILKEGIEIYKKNN